MAWSRFHRRLESAISELGQDFTGQEFKGIEDIFLGQSAVVYVEKLPLQSTGLLELAESVEHLLRTSRHSGTTSDRLFELGGGNDRGLHAGW